MNDFTPDYEALFVALVLAPGTFSRNKNFQLFESQEGRYFRRRSQMLRSLVKELTEPWPIAPSLKTHSAPVVDLKRDGDDFLLSYSVAELNYQRSARLNALEMATLNYALHRACGVELSARDRDRVESVLQRLGQALAQPNNTIS